MKKRVVALVSVVMVFAMVASMLALPAAGLATAEDDLLLASEPDDPSTFTMVELGDPNYLDPAVDYESSGGEVIQNTYETLVWYDGESAANFVPLLATEVPTLENGGISADGMVYTFHIRDGVTFHDGTDLTADDVVYSIQRVLRIHDPDSPSWMVEQVMTDYLSFYIGQELQSYVDDMNPPQWVIDAIGESDPLHVLTEDDNQAVAEAAVTKVDDVTVSFRLVKPYAGFLSICAATVMSIVSMDYVEANGGIVNGEHNEVMDETVCGTGPFTLAYWEKGVQVHLTRFSGYWGPTPELDDVYILTQVDQDVRMSMLENGTADSILMSIEYESLYADDPDYFISKGVPKFDMTFAGFNMYINVEAAADYGGTVPSDFFTDKDVRLAFVSMLDYATFIENILKGNALLPNGPIPKGMFGYDESVPTYQYDLELAKMHLQAAINPDTGNSWWVDGFSVALFYNAGNTYRETTCMYLKAALDDLTAMAESDTGAVFEGVVNTLDWPTYLAMLRTFPSPFPMFYLGWAPDYADPDDYTTAFLDSVYGTFTHNTGYSNESIDGLVRAASVELNQDVRAEMYSDILQLVYEDAPYMWLWQGANFHIERSWVDGYNFNPMYCGLYYATLSKGEVVMVPPDAVITLESDKASVDVPFSLDGTASSDDRNIVSYVWVIVSKRGDVSVLFGPVVEHVFAEQGVYSVTLVVTDDDGLQDSETVTVQVTGSHGGNPSLLDAVGNIVVELLAGVNPY